MPHPAIAVRPDGLGPLREQAHGFVANLRVARRFGHARQAAEPLAEDGVAVRPAPAAQRLSRRGQPGRLAVTVQDVVFGKPQPEIARGLMLFLPAAGPKLHAVIIERLNDIPGRQRRGGLFGQTFGDAGGGEDRHRGGLQEIAAGDFCFHGHSFVACWRGI